MLPYQILLYVASSIVLLLIGAAIGWLFGDRDDAITISRLRIGVAIIVTIMWVITILAEILVPSYSVALVIHGIMGAVVGYLFSENSLSEILKRG